MTNIYGPGVGRNLDSKDRQYQSVVFQADKPPIAEEWNLLTESVTEISRVTNTSDSPSGWISNAFDPKKDYRFDPKASNLFWLGRKTSGEDAISYAVVNGWVIPVAGTRSTDLSNAIELPPVQTTTSTPVHFVFLEVWKAQVSPDGTNNKPSEGELYRFGNVEFGGPNLPNQILDPRYGIETSERVQLQYRIRIAENINPESRPFGFGPGVLPQGPLSTPYATSNPAYQFQNMGEELGDPGLWRAGIPNQVTSNGLSITNVSALNTVDGYVYAIPLCMVFQRTEGVWSVSAQGQGVNRNPNAADRSDARVLPTVTLTAAITKDDLSIPVSVSQAATTFPLTNGRVKIGNEVINYQTWSGTTITVAAGGRGFLGTHATNHAEDAEVLHVSGHPLDLFADQIVEDDVLDMRHVIRGNQAYDAILKHNFYRLIKGDLKTQWQNSRANTKGLRHYQVDFFSDNQPVPQTAFQGDAPDGFRKVFSDAAAVQAGNVITVLSTGSAGSGAYSLNVANVSGYKNTTPSTTPWQDGDAIRIPLDSLRSTFKTANTNKVRFVHPLEYGTADRRSYQSFRLQFADAAFEGADLREGSEFLVLGQKPSGIAANLLQGANSTITYTTGGTITITDNVSNPVDFSSVVQDLVDQDAYIVLQPNGAGASFKGAYKIIGDDGGQGLLLDGFNPSSNTGIAGNWYIRLRRCTEADDEVFVVLKPNQSGNDYAASTLYVTFDVLYHPNQGMARVPEISLYTRLDDNSGSGYVRPRGFENQATSTSRAGGPRDYPTVPVENHPLRSGSARIRNNQNMRTSIEDVSAEAYVDRGSKTLIFQPLRQVNVTLDSYSASTGLTSDVASNLGYRMGTDPCIYVPKALLPKAGRLDLPFQCFTDVGETVPFGLNAILPSVQGIGTSSTLINQALVTPRVLALHDPTNFGAGDYGTYVPSASNDTGENVMIARIYDKGGVRGIELPQHVGIARLFGAYVVADYVGSQFTSGSNYTSVNPAFTGVNVLRKDHVGRSLIITEDNTFVVPEQALDMDLVGDSLSDARIVLEMSTFIFEDWSAPEVRLRTRSSQTAPGASATYPMYQFAPVDSVDTFWHVGTRIPYQGNLSGTLGQGFFDYSPKRQADRVQDIATAQDPLDPREVEITNGVSVEILTTLPFVTTLGTGKIAGEFGEGAYTDVGYLSQEGFPAVTNPRQVRSRAFDVATKPRSRADVLTGMTERLPIGLLASDHLFIGEGLGPQQEAFWTPSQMDLEGYLSENEAGYPLEKPFGEGSLVLSEGTHGGSATGIEYDNTANMFRTYRGGTLTVESGLKKGGAFVASGPQVFKSNPTITEFSSAINPLVLQYALGQINQSEYEEAVEAVVQDYRKRFQIHGACLFGVAMLVRTRKEELDTITSSYGQELQMLVVTGATFGMDQMISFLDEANAREVADLLIQIHPTGFGEGFSAADKFRVEGRLLERLSKSEAVEDLDLYTGADPAEDPDSGCSCP